MTNLLLLGAGFSRNWGGWLADEVFEHLLGSAEVQSNDAIRTALWRAQNEGGGFELALSRMQLALRTTPSAELSDQVAALQRAITMMFREMDRGMSQVGANFEFSQMRAFQVGEFLARFDAIFSLNQNVLLERRYVDVDTAMSSGRWTAAVIPGVLRSKVWAGGQPVEPQATVQEPPYEIPKRCQPLFKLHGSWDWRSADGQDLLVVGGDKGDAIRASPLLRWFDEEFRARISQPGARLLVIGYAFKDAHINASLEAAVKTGLKLFVIDPLGVRAVLGGDVGPKGALTTLEQGLIGASRRGLSEIFREGSPEYPKVMRFFAR